MSQDPSWLKDPRTGTYFRWMPYNGQYYQYFQDGRWGDAARSNTNQAPAQPIVNENRYGTQPINFQRNVPAAQSGMHPDYPNQDPDATPRAAPYLPNLQGLSLQDYPQGGARAPVTWQDQHGVITSFSEGPVDQISDPVLLRTWNIHADKQLHGTEGKHERLDKSFRKRGKPQEFFQVGKVFTVLWSQPVGNVDETNLTEVTVNKWNEGVHTKIRRFVVIRAGNDFCSVLPITTYNGKGVGKRGVTKKEHVIVHTGKRAPSPMPTEMPAAGQQGMPEVTFRVVPDQKDWKLDARSRLNCGKVFTVEHNLKVKSFGKVLKEKELIRHFVATWLALAPLPRQPTMPEHGEPSRRRGQALPPIDEGEYYAAAGPSTLAKQRMTRYIPGQTNLGPAESSSGEEADSNEDAASEEEDEEDEEEGDDDDDDDDDHANGIHHATGYPPR